MQSELVQRIRKFKDGPLAGDQNPLELWSKTLAHLEPVPADLWLELVGDEKTARNSWLLAYDFLRRLHRSWDRESAKRDRRQGSAVHPQLWRVDQWKELGPSWIQAAAATKPMKAHKRGVVCRVPAFEVEGADAAAIGGDGEHGLPEHLILKHFPPHKKVDPRNAIGMSKAIASLHACEALNRRGLRAAVGYAAWSAPKQGSWLLLEDLHGFESLQNVILELHGDDRAALLAGLARYARRMHLLGVAFRDFKPSNIMVRFQAADDFEIAVIDHDRNWFLRHEIAPSRARRDLAALHAGLPNEVRASERMKALRIYGGRWRKHRCDWGYRGPLWEQQMPKLFEEAVRRNREWKPIGLLGG